VPLVGDEPAMRDWAAELVAQARAEAVELTGDNGLLTGLVRQVLQTGVEVEMTDHLGYERHAAAGRGSGNSRNGMTSKTVTTEVGKVELRVPRDREGSFDPQTVRKGQRRLDGLSGGERADRRSVRIRPGPVARPATSTGPPWWRRHERGRRRAARGRAPYGERNRPGQRRPIRCRGESGLDDRREIERRLSSVDARSCGSVDQRPPHFNARGALLAPRAGAATLYAEVLRAGGSTSQVRARLDQPGTVVQELLPTRDLDARASSIGTAGCRRQPRPRIRTASVSNRERPTACAQRSPSRSRCASNPTAAAARSASMIDDVIERWLRYRRSSMPDILDELLDDDVMYYPPVTGKEPTKRHLLVAAIVFPFDTGGGDPSGSGRFRYTKRLAVGDTAMLEFEADLYGGAVNGVDIIRCSDAGRIVEFRIFIRPLPALNAAHGRSRAAFEGL
jgi:hypothetical protein